MNYQKLNWKKYIQTTRPKFLLLDLTDIKLLFSINKTNIAYGNKEKNYKNYAHCSLEIYIKAINVENHYYTCNF